MCLVNMIILNYNHIFYDHKQLTHKNTHESQGLSYFHNVRQNRHQLKWLQTTTVAYKNHHHTFFPATFIELQRPLEQLLFDYRLVCQEKGPPIQQ